MTTPYPIDLSAPPKPVVRGHLDLGGTGPAGSIAVNSFYIEQNGKPFIPVVGEIHYSRCPAEYWEEELRKMKAGGINVAATYVFWNIHERTEGQFDWSGDLDLRRFVGAVERAGLTVILRVGPFDHGEMRNGGLPDWLYGRALEVRSNDPLYLAYCDKLYAAIGAQVKGLFYKDGGPIIGIQLENEFQHSAAPWEIRYAGAPRELTVADRDAAVTHVQISAVTVANENAGYGRDHMSNLKLIAKKNGLDAPLYTATGWGNAAIVPNGSLPVTAAYSYPYWAKEPTPSPFYLFKDIQRVPDYMPVSFETHLYPSLPAEAGVGMNQVYARRSYVPTESVEPMMVRMLGSGANGLGYYMYHGGATPAFDNLFYNEDASGLPKINYDYQAPLGQYGQVRDHFRSLRLLHLFLESYGERLAPCASVLPPNHADATATDTHVLRYAARGANGSGFVFLLNFQDHAETHDIPDLRLDVNDGKRAIPVPSSGTFTLKRGVAAILPINLDVGGNTLRSATVQPLCILRRGEGNHYVFFSVDGLRPELVFDSGSVTDAENCRVATNNGMTVVSGPADQCFTFTIDGKPVLVIPRHAALQATRVDGGRLVFTSATVISNGAEVTLLSTGQTSVEVNVYPAASAPPRVSGAASERVTPPVRAMSAFRVEFAPVSYSATLRRVTGRRHATGLGALPDTVNDVFMRVNYVGDTAMAFVDGRMVDDHFYSGRPWEIGLKRFVPRPEGTEMVFVFHPLERASSCLQDVPPEFHPPFAADQNRYLEVGGLEFIPEYKAIITLPAGELRGG